MEKKVEKNCFKRVYGYMIIVFYVLCIVMSSCLLQDVWSQMVFTISILATLYVVISLCPA